MLYTYRVRKNYTFNIVFFFLYTKMVYTLKLFHPIELSKEEYLWGRKATNFVLLYYRRLNYTNYFHFFYCQNEFTKGKKEEKMDKIL